MSWNEYGGACSCVYLLADQSGLIKTVKANGSEICELAGTTNGVDCGRNCKGLCTKQWNWITCEWNLVPVIKWMNVTLISERETPPTCNTSRWQRGHFHISTVSYTRVGTLIVATIYLQLIQNRYMFRSFTLLQCSHQHCVQPAASDVEVVGYL